MRVSVCMASYNGERYIREQLHSILDQIGKDDEVIIVDDASTDETVKIIESIADPRIKLVTQNNNLGHVKSFESSISLASNEIIILSDQDDIWHPGKYQLTLEEFKKQNSLMLLVHSLSSIDEDGHIISREWISLPAVSLSGIKFIFFEIFNPRVWGSASAFRNDILDIFLPFPKYVYKHEDWLIICAALKGNSQLKKDSHVFHRLHDQNVTSKNKINLNYLKKIYIRLLYVPMICVAFYRSVLLAISKKNNDIT